MRAPTLSTLLWLLPQLIGSSKASTYHNATSDLRVILSNASWSEGTIISYPGSDEFLNATERRVATYLPTYAAAVTPATEEDVATAVKLAVQHNIRFLATGGRHGFGLGYGTLKEGLSIDLSLFKGFTADPASATATIGGAATVAEFHDQLYDAGLMLPSGSCSCPGYLGLGVGGGIGRYMGTLGMVTDRIVSARVVTAAGDILTVSEDEHADLFWALRGAGANFGIVTSATFQAARAVDHNDGFALTVDMYFTPNSTARYFQHLEAVADSLPGNVAGIHITQYNSVSGEAELAVNWVWFGPEAAGRAFMAQFTALGPATVKNYAYVPWSRVISTVFDGLGETALCVKNEYASTYASNLRAFDAATYQATFEALAAYYVDHPHGRGTNTNLEVFPNQAVAALRADFSAYPWRDTRAFFTFSATLDDLALAANQTLVDAGDGLGARLRDAWTKTGGYAEEGGVIYVNYARGDEPLENIYGNHLPRLVALKKKWDPDRIFAYNNALPTSHP